MARAHNFNAGPAGLPLPALERAQRELLDFEGTGMSIMEHSHRGKAYEGVHDEAIALTRALLGVPDDYYVLFLQGGASLQFAQVPMNFLPAGQERRLHRHRRLGGEGVPGGAAPRHRARRGHHRGRQALHAHPPPGGAQARPRGGLRPHDQQQHALRHPVALASRRWAGPAHRRHVVATSCGARSTSASSTLIYAGAQKNIGPSGVVVVLAKKAYIDGARKDIPTILRYATHAANNSLYNTPPTFGIYLIRNVLAYIKDSGGLEAVEATEPEEGRSALRDHRRERGLLPRAGRQGQPIVHERRLPPPHRGAGEELRLRRRQAADGGPRRSPLHRRHPRLALQRGRPASRWSASSTS